MSDKILVLDDELNFAEMLHELLVERGYDAEITTRPTEALQRLKDEDFALVLADYKMPEMNGAEFLVEARKRMPDLPVIMISGLMNTPDLLKVANIGVTLVLEKPIDVSDFFDQVRRFAEPAVEQSGNGDSGSGPRTAVVSYPKPLAYFSDMSGLGRVFMQNVWDALQSHRQIVFGMPPGSELGLISREIARFLRSEAGKPVCSFPLKEAVTTIGRTRLQKVALDADYASVISIEVDDVDAELSLLQDFLEFTSSDIVLRDAAYFIIALKTEDSLGGRLPPELTEHFPVVFPFYLRLAPLRERMADAAYYFHRLIRSRFGGSEVFADEGPVLTQAALRLFLAQPWKGNYAELAGVVSAIPMRPPEQIGVTLLNDWIDRGRRNSDMRDELAGTGSLQDFLRSRQRSFLQELSAEHDELRDVALAAGIEAARLDPSQPLQHQPLLYPELLDNLSLRGIDDAT